jgi:hypothetical protein
MAGSAKEHKADLLAAMRGNPQLAESAIEDSARLTSNFKGIGELINSEILDWEHLCEKCTAQGGRTHAGRTVLQCNRGRAPNALAACFLLIAVAILVARNLAQRDSPTRSGG